MQIAYRLCQDFAKLVLGESNNKKVKKYARMLANVFFCFPIWIRLGKHKLLSNDLSLPKMDRELVRYVKNRISIRDTMYEGDPNNYFRIGLEALHCIEKVLIKADVKSVQNILDLPCGYGRVSRFLARRFSDAEITVCDIERKAVDFCVRTFDANGLYSHADVNNIVFKQQFELIWCGSLFTHLPAAITIDFLKLFYRCLSLRGVLIFTTHGQSVVDGLTSRRKYYALTEKDISTLKNCYDKTGYGYVNYAGGNIGYGFSVVTLDCIRRHLDDIGGWKLIYFGERAWDNHQDVFGILKEDF